MVRPKGGGSSKKPNRGVDFKKIKRKIGRKLPPPKNATNTQIKCKAIILPEQSVASDRAGLAVNKKGLTLRELLQQTSHHNAKIRRAALTGIRELIGKHPSELNIHKVAIIEKLRERICDADRVVRDTLYQLLEALFSQCSKEDITGQLISLLMAYVFNAMTHMAVDIRLMAFKFLELIVLNYPSSSILYAEKVLDSYTDVLRNNQIYLDKSKLKNVLGGLDRCLSSLAKKKEENNLSCESKIIERRHLHAFEGEVHKEGSGISSVVNKVDYLVPILVNCFREYTSLIRVSPIIDAQSFDCMLLTLQCINLAVNIFLRERQTPNARSGPLLPSPNEPPVKQTMFVHLKKLWESFPIGKVHPSGEKEDERFFILDLRSVEIFLHLIGWIDQSRIPIEKFLEFIENLLLVQVDCNLLSNKVFLEKHCRSVIPFIPRLVSHILGSWKTRILEAFTGAFEVCNADSKLCMAYLSAIEEMMESESDLSVASNCSDILEFQIAWIHVLPNILLRLGDKHSSVSKVVLKLLVQIGQCSLPDSRIASEFECVQRPLKEFFSTRSKGVAGTVHHGPFLKLPRDCQELAVCCLYYFSNLNAELLESLTTCCLCEDIDPDILLRIVEILNSAYKAGHVQISNQIGILVTLVARLKVLPEKFCNIERDGKVSNRGTFRSLIAAACSCLSLMGDSSLVLKLLCRKMFNDMSLKPALDNMYGFFWMIVMLDTTPTKLSEENIVVLSNWLSVYLIEAASYISEHADVSFHSDEIHIFQYYMQPCMFLFYGSDKLLFQVLNLLQSWILEDRLSILSQSNMEYASEPSYRVHVVSSLLIFMYNDVRLHRSLSSCETVIKHILQNVLNLLDPHRFSDMNLEAKNKIQIAFDQLKTRICKTAMLQCK